MAKPLIVTVLKSGGEYNPQHVHRLAKMLPEHIVYCLTDLTQNTFNFSRVIVLPLKYTWAGWWSKMELFRPDFIADWLYVDLDTNITGDISDFLQERPEPVMLSDFYFPERPASGVMYLPALYRAKVWDEWVKNPHGHMATCGTLGDQAFLRQVYGDDISRWQDVLPGQVVSYKVHCRDAGRVPDNARIVCFHGKPRPWQL